MGARQALGAAITIIGLLLLLYGITVGALHKHIGSYASLKFDNSTGKLVVEGKPGGISSDAAAVLVGWFFILVGPAIWAGEVPVTIKAKVER